MHRLLHKRVQPRARDERGAALVEAAMVIFVLMLVVLGIFEFGLAFKDKLTVTSATRSGARVASAQARVASYANSAKDAVRKALNALPSDAPVSLWIYKANSTTGLPDNGTFATEGCNVCIVYHWNATTKDWDAPVINNWPSSSQNACAYDAASNPNGPDTVGIYIKANHKSTTGAFFSSSTLTDKTLMKLEPQPAGACS